MDQKLRVTSIVLTTANGMRVELTIPEARDLHEQLAKMFGKNLVNTPVIIERHHWPMPWHPYQPMWVSDQTGDDRHRQSVLVLWRTLTDDPEKDVAALEAYLSQQMKFDPTRREDKTLYDIIYINGTHNLPNLGKYGEVRLLEEEFHRRMWAGEGN